MKESSTTLNRHTAATWFFSVVVNLMLLKLEVCQGLRIYIRAGLGHSKVRRSSGKVK